MAQYGQLQSPVSGSSPPAHLFTESSPRHADVVNDVDGWSASSHASGDIDACSTSGASFKVEIGPLKRLEPTATSKLATRRNSKEGKNIKQQQPTTTQERKEADDKKVGWEPVSPGILDRSPEVQAQIRKKEYYWPSAAEAAKASASSSTLAPPVAAGPATSSISSNPASVPNVSKALEYSFPLDGLEGGMLQMSNVEFRGLLKSALTSKDIDTTRSLVTTPLPRSVGTIRCFIKRNKSGLMNTFYPSYELFLEEEPEAIFIMSSKKRTKNRTSNYTISLLTVGMLEKSNHAAKMTSEDPNYLGKLRANFTGSEFTGYDAGLNPKIPLSHSHSSQFSRSNPAESKFTNIRQELCHLTFETNILSRCPRKFMCIIPGMLKEEDSKRIVCKPLLPTDTLAYQAKALQETEAEKNPQLHQEQIQYKEVMILSNKEPIFEPSIGAYCLNFNGRATIASVKNFQLVNQKGDKARNPIHLQFDTAYPLSLVQAFEICLAGLDTKFVCD